MTDLGTPPGDVASIGESINDGGQAVGLSFDANGNLRAFYAAPALRARRRSN